MEGLIFGILRWTSSDQSDHHMKPGLAVDSIITKSYVLYYNCN